MPLTFIELKKASVGGDDLKSAHTQLTGTYVAELPLAFRCNVVCLVSDGFAMQYGTAFTPYEHFAPWNVDDDGKPVKQPAADLVDQPIMLLLHGMFRHDRFLDLLFGYVAFARDADGMVKRIAKPHQYFAVAEAVRKTIEAVRGDGRAGVFWHTQGSGKSMEMELYANQVLTQHDRACGSLRREPPRRSPRGSSWRRPRPAPLPVPLPVPPRAMARRCPRAGGRAAAFPSSASRPAATTPAPSAPTVPCSAGETTPTASSAQAPPAPPILIRAPNAVNPSSRSPRLSEQVLRPPNGHVRASAWRSCQPPWLARCAERADVIESGAQPILLSFEVVAGLKVHPESLGGTEISR
jgi:hypothetical protein